MKILVTGSSGFLGRNLISRLAQRPECEILEFEKQHSRADLHSALSVADAVFHFAGVNRPIDNQDFERENVGLTEDICHFLKEQGRSPKILFASSIQAELDNPYGLSKKHAELVLQEFANETGSCVIIRRLKNLFGKWCRPDYNSVTATFCHNIARGIPIAISNPNVEIDLCYVDDAIEAFLTHLDHLRAATDLNDNIPSHRISLGDLADRIRSFRGMKSSLTVPDFASPFNRALYATYLSHVPDADLEEHLPVKTDTRGCLAEILKSSHFGQIFLSRTAPGITRGNHYHHSKTEKFLVIEGEGLVKMRQIFSKDIVEYHLRGCDYQVLNIPPGYTHSIQNVGKADMVTLFWADEIFDQGRPDTYYLPVEPPA